MLDKNIHYHINFPNLEESYKFQEYMLKKGIGWILSHLNCLNIKYLVLKYVDNVWVLGLNYDESKVKFKKPGEIKQLLDDPLKYKIRKLKRILHK